MHIDCHALVCRIVVHVSHHHYLDARIFFHETYGMLVDDLCPAAPEVHSLAADTGRKMGHEESEHLASEQSPDHQHVTGTEIVLLLLREGEGDGSAVEIKRN